MRREKLGKPTSSRLLIETFGPRPNSISTRRLSSRVLIERPVKSPRSPLLINDDPLDVTRGRDVGWGGWGASIYTRDSTTVRRFFRDTERDVDTWRVYGIHPRSVSRRRKPSRASLSPSSFSGFGKIDMQGRQLVASVATTGCDWSTLMK